MILSIPFWSESAVSLASSSFYLWKGANEVCICDTENATWTFFFVFFSVPVPVVSLEKIPNLVKADGANVKMNSATTTTITSSSASSSTIPAPTLVKSGLTTKSVPPSPEKILNGKGIIAPSIDKKHQNGTKSSNKPYKRLSGE